MWHASIAAMPGYPMTEDDLKAIALSTLARVGDASLGEWQEWSGTAYHIKRRLSRKEQQSVGQPKDIRNTPEQNTRQMAVRKYLPQELKDWKE